jgi:hypothetical protein
MRSHNRSQRFVLAGIILICLVAARTATAAEERYAEDVLADLKKTPATQIVTALISKEYVDFNDDARLIQPQDNPNMLELADQLKIAEWSNGLHVVMGSWFRVLVCLDKDKNIVGNCAFMYYPEPHQYLRMSVRGKNFFGIAEAHYEGKRIKIGDQLWSKFSKPNGAKGYLFTSILNLDVPSLQKGKAPSHY